MENLSDVLGELRQIGAVAPKKGPPVKQEVIASMPQEVRDSVKEFNEHLMRLGPALDHLQAALAEIGAWADTARKFVEVPVPGPEKKPE